MGDFSNPGVGALRRADSLAAVDPLGELVTIELSRWSRAMAKNHDPDIADPEDLAWPSQITDRSRGDGEEVLHR